MHFLWQTKGGQQCSWRLTMTIDTRVSYKGTRTEPTKIPSLEGWRGAPEWVRSRFHNPPQGLTALAPPKRGIVRLIIRRGMKYFHALGCSTGAWMAPCYLTIGRADED